MSTKCPSCGNTSELAPLPDVLIYDVTFRACAKCRSHALFKEQLLSLGYAAGWESAREALHLRAHTFLPPHEGPLQ